jgi:site-specific DNA-methyltransferase (adenine-specific)
VDAIITDPPYPREYLGLFGDLSKLAADILAPHGVLVAMVGQWHLREYLAELSRHLDYRWTASYIAQGARTRVHAARVGTGWKPLLVFQRTDAREVPFLLDDLFCAATTSAQTNGDKRFHEWGQSEEGIAEQVERFTLPGQLVVDPFLGGGTTAVVCKALGRRFIGCDVDAAAVHTSRERMA